MWAESSITELPGPIDLGKRRRTWPFLVLFSFVVCAPLAAQTCNSAPLAIDDQAFHEGVLVLIDVLANDVEPDGEAMTVATGATTCAGTVSEDFGLVSLQPVAPAEREDCTIDYQVFDEQGASASATVFVHSTCTDSDLDGSCDELDTCPGFDDNADADADGIPDGCDSCPAGLTLTAREVVSTVVYESCTSITAGDGFHVLASGNVTFRAGGHVALGDDFSLETGAAFRIEIDPALAPTGARAGEEQ